MNILPETVSMKKISCFQQKCKKKSKKSQKREKKKFCWKSWRGDSNDEIRYIRMNKQKNAVGVVADAPLDRGEWVKAMKVSAFFFFFFFFFSRFLFHSLLPSGEETRGRNR